MTRSVIASNPNSNPSVSVPVRSIRGYTREWCAGNACHTWAFLKWDSLTKVRYIKGRFFYLFLLAFEPADEQMPERGRKCPVGRIHTAPNTFILLLMLLQLQNSAAGARCRRWHAAMPEQSNDYRVVVFGAGGVGKSSLVLRFVRGTFRDTYVPTIEDTYRQVISCNKQVRFSPPFSFKLQIIHNYFCSCCRQIRISNFWIIRQ